MKKLETMIALLSLLSLLTAGCSEIQGEREQNGDSQPPDEPDHRSRP